MSRSLTPETSSANRKKKKKKKKKNQNEPQTLENREKTEEWVLTVTKRLLCDFQQKSACTWLPSVRSTFYKAQKEFKLKRIYC
jgi:hypothetical protein